MFSIDYGLGPLGVVILAGLAFVGFIAVTMFFSIARKAREDVLEDEHDHGNDDVPPA